VSNKLLIEEIKARAKSLTELLSPCILCPHMCAVDRAGGELGECGVGFGATIASAVPHFGEEPEISGKRGSGTIFFSGCNLHCCYCQNSQISQNPRPIKGDSVKAIVDAMISLKARGCHNINWVTPSHIAPFAVLALAIARSQGMDLPIVYNSSGYDGLECLKLLDGIVDIYLADLRYSDDDCAAEFSLAPNYVSASRAAVLEMARQVGTDNPIGADGTLERGLIIRLLVLPNDLSGVADTLYFIKENLGTSVRIALMAQYFPAYKASNELLLSRPTSFREYSKIVDLADKMGFSNALIQEHASAEFYRPNFEKEKEPSEDIKHFIKRG
jgi:putative pyruvate formate lyase activating enzyme